VDCVLTELDAGKWWCEKCDPRKEQLLRVKARRNCGKQRAPYRERPPPPTPEEIAERLWVCRKNVCGEYVRNREAGGKEQELCYCTTTCQGKPTPIEKLCSHAPGCPGGGHW